MISDRGEQGTVLCLILDKQGNDVIAAIHINKKYGRNVINKIANIYSKSDDFGNNKINNYISQQIQNGNLIDASKNKASMWFTSRGLQLPKLVQTIIDASNSVSQENTTVNNNSMQKALKFHIPIRISFLAKSY